MEHLFHAEDWAALFAMIPVIEYIRMRINLWRTREDRDQGG